MRWTWTKPSGKVKRVVITLNMETGESCMEELDDPPPAKIECNPALIDHETRAGE